LAPCSELAIGGGDPLSHPDLREFLEKLKRRKIISNLTVSQYHFTRNYEFIKLLIENRLIYGLGVSLDNLSDEFVEKVSQFDNAVIHTIAGIADVEMLENLAGAKLKVLILGYKRFRRGEDFYSEAVAERISQLRDRLPAIISTFKLVSLDNLALEQLDVKSLFPKKRWDEFYMGDDGNFTMYVDLVARTFAKNSASDSRFGLTDDVRKMFDIIRAESSKERERR
jgi:hypothetical protein